VKDFGSRLGVIGLVIVMLLTACGTNSNAVILSSDTMLPDFLKDADVRVKQAYQFAAEHPQHVANYPCFCGCVFMGHKNNLDCYVSDIAADGTITFDNHASGCGVCVDITQDVMRMMNEGKAAPQIWAYINAEYSRFGPSTDTVAPIE